MEQAARAILSPGTNTEFVAARGLGNFTLDPILYSSLPGNAAQLPSRPRRALFRSSHGDEMQACNLRRTVHRREILPRSGKLMIPR